MIRTIVRVIRSSVGVRAALPVVAVGLVFATGGCGSHLEVAQRDAALGEMKQVGLALDSYQDGRAVPTSRVALGPAEEQSAAKGPAARPSATSRKIVYTAEITLVVLDFSKAEQLLEQHVTEAGGYIAETDVHGRPGVPQYGTWKIRVPVDRFEIFRKSIARLGELQRSQLTSQDVTDEYFDLGARLKNKKVEEARLLKHLENSTPKLSDTLEVERELSRVREEIERMEGRRILLDNLATMTTVTVTINSLQGYVPDSEPTFATSIGRTFWGSVDALGHVAKLLVLGAVALAPWLPLLLVAGFFLWRGARRLDRVIRTRTRPATPAAT